MFPLFRATDIFQYGRYSTDRESAKFQAQRKGRLHAGFDFDSTLDTPIHAPIDLEIIRKPYLYYRETYAIDLKSQDHVSRFCEIKDPTTKQEGEILKKGEIIGKVGDLKLSNSPNMGAFRSIFAKKCIRSPLVRITKFDITKQTAL